MKNPRTGQGNSNVSTVCILDALLTAFSTTTMSKQENYPKLLNKTQHLVIRCDTRTQNVGGLTGLGNGINIFTPPRYMIKHKTHAAHWSVRSTVSMRTRFLVALQKRGQKSLHEIGQHRLLSGSQVGTTLDGHPEYTRWSLPLMERAVEIT